MMLQNYKYFISLIYFIFLSTCTEFLICSVMEDAYILKDPFTGEKRCIILGSHCSVCNRIVCVSQV